MDIGPLSPVSAYTSRMPNNTNEQRLQTHRAVVSTMPRPLERHIYTRSRHITVLPVRNIPETREYNNLT